MDSRPVKKSLYILIVWICFATDVGAQYYETSILPGANDQFKKAKYRIWLPEGVRMIRGIIVRQHGCGLPASSTGLDYANDLQWQALARKHEMALMGSELENFEICAQWFDLESGSEKAFLNSLKHFSILSSHPELELVPWAFYGHSGGAYWCTNMLFKYPERILVCINRSGGIASSRWNQKMNTVPVLWVAGEYDVADSLEYVKGLTLKSFNVYRKFGAPWSVAIDPKAGHENRQGRSFYIPYMDAMLSQRLPSAGFACRPLDSTESWLGNWKSKEIFPAKGASNIYTCCWFPDKATAEKWKEFVLTGSVADTTPPPVPFNLHHRTVENKTYLQWSSLADLESGIKQFNIYNNNTLLAIFPGQTHNHGDVAQPAIAKFIYPLAGEKGTFSVAAVNHQNLESEKSNAVKIN